MTSTGSAVGPALPSSCSTVILIEERRFESCRAAAFGSLQEDDNKRVAVNPLENMDKVSITRLYDTSIPSHRHIEFATARHYCLIIEYGGGGTSGTE